jgi:hypothetical protein
MKPAERIRTQQRKDKNNLYTLHTPEVECIGKGKVRNPYECGVKVSIAVTHNSGLMVGARSFPSNPGVEIIHHGKYRSLTALIVSGFKRTTQGELHETQRYNLY